jgi:hypothetical protein
VARAHQRIREGSDANSGGFVYELVLGHAARVTAVRDLD